MEDRELLELSAKAAGIKIDKSSRNGGGHGNNGFDIPGNAVLDWHNGEKWNPLNDDGDAFRLALKLQIKIEYVPEMDSVMCSLPGSMGATSVAAIGDVELRYAIVQAAAQLGLAMP